MPSGRGPGLAMAIAILGLVVVASPAGAFQRTYTVADDYMTDNEGLAVSGRGIESLTVIEGQDSQGYIRSYVYSTPSRLAGISTGDLLNRRCELPEGVAADGDAVVAACSPSWTSSQLYVHRRSNGAWAAGVAVQRSTRPTKGSVSIAISGRTVVVAWTDRRTGGIYLARSTNGGASFQKPALLGTTTFRFRQGSAGWDVDGHVQVAIRGSHVYVAWYASYKKVGKATRPKGIKFRRSTNSGASFSAARTLTGGTQYPGRIAEPVSPAMVATPTGVLIVHVTEQRQVRLLRSVDAGHTFSSSGLTEQGQTTTGEVDIAAAGEQARVIWRKGTHVYLRRSRNGGRTWSAREDTGVSRRQDVVISPNVVLYEGATVVGWNAATAWEGLGDLWVEAGILS